MVYKLLTLDGTLVLDEVAGTVALGTDAAVPAAGAVASVETAGEISRRITASRIVLTGVFALAWRKKKDDRELYVTVQTSATTMLARVDPKRAEMTRRFAVAVNDVGAGRAVTDDRLAQLSIRNSLPRTTEERKVAEKEKVARMTPDQKRAYDKRNNILVGVILAFFAIMMLIALLR